MSIFAFASLAGIHVNIVSSVVGIKISAVTAKNQQLRKRKGTMTECLFLAKSKLSNREVLVHRALIDTCISHDEFLTPNKKLREYDDDGKEEIKNIKSSAVYSLWKTMLLHCLRYRKKLRKNQNM